MNDLTHRNKHIHTLADNAVIAFNVYNSKRRFTHLLECFNFKSGCVAQVVERLKRDWFIVLLRQLWVKTTLYHIEIRIIYLIVKFKCLYITIYVVLSDKSLPT